MINKNSIFETAFKLFEYIAPGNLTDPEKAYKKVVDTMGGGNRAKRKSVG